MLEYGTSQNSKKQRVSLLRISAFGLLSGFGPSGFGFQGRGAPLRAPVLALYYSRGAA